jgi:hypothetical protein
MDLAVRGHLWLDRHIFLLPACIPFISYLEMASFDPLTLLVIATQKKKWIWWSTTKRSAGESKPSLGPKPMMGSE